MCDDVSCTHQKYTSNSFDIFTVREIAGLHFRFPHLHSGTLVQFTRSTKLHKHDAVCFGDTVVRWYIKRIRNQVNLEKTQTSICQRRVNRDKRCRCKHDEEHFRRHSVSLNAQHRCVIQHETASKRKNYR